MKTISLMAPALALLLTAGLASGLASCAKDDITTPDDNARPGAPLTLTINCAVSSENPNKSTRATVAPGNPTDDTTKGEAFRWNAGDDFNAYLVKTTTTTPTWVLDESGTPVATPFAIDKTYVDASSASASFTGTFAEADTYQMLALYPGTLKDGAAPATPAFTPGTGTDNSNQFAFALPPTGQTQKGTTTTHLRDNMLMWATATTPVTVGTETGATAPGLRFHHLTTMMRFTVKNKAATGRRVTALSITAGGTVFGTKGVLTQSPTSWTATPGVSYTPDKAVNTITLNTQDGADASLGMPLATAGNTGHSFDAYLLTLPGDALTGQTLTFTLTATDADGSNPETYERKLNAQAILDKNPGATTFEAGKRYWFNLELAAELNVASFTVSPWATGDEIITDNHPEILLMQEAGKNIYQIRTAAGLKAFADIVNGTDDGQPRTFCGINIPGTSTEEARKSNARLMADIDLGTLCGASIEGKSKSWTPIGKDGNSIYTGTFDGAGHTVSGLYINDERKEINTDIPNEKEVYRGLFGRLEGGGVQHLAVEGSINVDLTATEGGDYLWICVGGIVARTNGFITLTDCHSAVSISAKGEYTGAEKVSTVAAGGIVGSIVGSRVTDCSSTGAVSATASALGREQLSVGGICGDASNVTLMGCSHTTGAVSGTTTRDYTYVGGIVGYYSSGTSSQLLGCTNTAAVSASAAVDTAYPRVGGVVGVCDVDVVACSNSGAVTYTSGRSLGAGGVVGWSRNAVVASFSTGTLSGTSSGTSSYIGGIIGGNQGSGSASTCFYTGTTDLGTDGIGGYYGSNTTNTDGGRVATLAELNAKVDAMNAAIESYNAAGTGAANPCPYRWTAASNPASNLPTLVKK